MGEVKRHLDALEAQHAGLLSQIGQSSRTSTNIERVVRMVREIQEETLKEMDHMDLQQRQTLVRMLLRAVVIHDKNRVDPRPRS